MSVNPENGKNFQFLVNHDLFMYTSVHYGR